jgi:IPT/TIG domain
MNFPSAFSLSRISGQLIVVGLIVLSSCSSNNDPEPPALPQVSAISPTAGLVNTAVIITGTNFSTVLGENKVTFNGKEAVITAATVTQLTVTVPMDAETGPVAVTVNGQGVSNKPVFTVESPTPEVTKLFPTSGSTNTPVVISGANFSAVLSENKVLFNGKDAVVTAAAPTQLTVIVPLLSETGPVVVSVKGKAALNQPVFTVLAIPVLTTSTVSDIIVSTAIGGGNIISQGGSAVTARGICWSTNPTPNTLNNKTVNGSGIGVFSSSITGLTVGVTYYVRAYATNSFGTAYGNEITFKSLPILGAFYQAGFIAYIFLPGDPGYVEGESHGLIAASADDAIQASWASGAHTITGATGTALGTGATNTAAIVGSPGSHYAAQVCFDLKLDMYDDWFLPSKDELHKVYLAKDLIGDLNPGYYWTSSESGSDVWIQNFSTGVQSTFGKGGGFRVRAVRVF